MYQPLADSRPKKFLGDVLPFFSAVKALQYKLFGQTEDAVREWLRILEQSSARPKLGVVRHLIREEVYQEARDYLEKLLRQMRGAEMLFLLAKCYLGQGLLEQARDAINEALSLEPEQAKLWNLLADCLLEQGLWREATEALSKSLRTEPQNDVTLYRLGTIYARNGQYEDALHCFQGCCRLSPRNANYWEMKAEMHLILEHMAQARDSFERAWRYSFSSDILVRLAYCYVQTGKIAKGIRSYQTVLKHDPDHFDALCNLAAVLQNQGRSQEALPLLERALELQPNDPILLNNLAYTLVHLGRNRKAAEYYQAALRLAPRHPMILYNLAVCLTRKGAWQDSIAVLNLLLENEPAHTEGWILLGNIYDQLNKHDVAVDCYNRALKLA